MIKRKVFHILLASKSTFINDQLITPFRHHLLNKDQCNDCIIQSNNCEVKRLAVVISHIYIYRYKQYNLNGTLSLLEYNNIH